MRLGVCAGGHAGLRVGRRPGEGPAESFRPLAAARSCACGIAGAGMRRPPRRAGERAPSVSVGPPERERGQPTATQLSNGGAERPPTRGVQPSATGGRVSVEPPNATRPGLWGSRARVEVRIVTRCARALAPREASELLGCPGAEHSHATHHGERTGLRSHARHLLGRLRLLRAVCALL